MSLIDELTSKIKIALAVPPSGVVSFYSDLNFLNSLFNCPYFIAGGRVLSYRDRSIPCSDIDIWVEDPDSAWERLKKVASESELETKCYETDNAFSATISGLRVQIIRSFLDIDDPARILSTFDFDICSLGVLIDKGQYQWIYGRNFHEAFGRKTIGIRKPTVARRVEKYVQKGLMLTDNDMAFLQFDMHTAYEEEMKKMAEDYEAMQMEQKDAVCISNF